MANLITGAFRDRFALIGGRAPLQTFLLTLLVALLAVFDTFRYASVGIEDRLVRLLTVKANWQPQVMLVDDLPADSAGQQRVLQAMVSAGPALIVWMDDRGPVLPESAFAVPFLIAGEAATGEAPSPTGRRALLHVGSSEYGIHRYQELVAPPGNELGTMEATALAMLGRPVGEASRYLINFRPVPGLFGRFHAREILAGHVLPAMMAGRVLLVAANSQYTQPRFEVPTSPAWGVFSQLEFHAYALETLLADRAPQRPSVGMRGLLILLVGLSTGLLATLLIDRVGLWLLLVAGSLVVAVWWSSFSWALFSLPLILMLLTVFGVVTVYRLELARSRSRIVQNLLMQSAQRAQERLRQESADAEQEWNRIIVMVSQMLNLERSIFLMVRQDDHYVHEVAALRCSVEDIREQRRDYHRAPYTDAIEARGLIQLEHRMFLSEPAEGAKDQQFMLPILLEGDLQGFWCLTVAPERFSGLPALESEVKPFADQIAQRMVHMAYQQRMQAAGESPERYERKREEFFPELRLRAVITLLENRLTQYENVFGGLTTATIVYDIFGRVQQVNQRMLELLGNSGWQPYQMTALEMLVALAVVPLEEARNQLRRLVVGRATVTLPDFIHIGKKAYQLVLSPVLTKEEREGEQSGVGVGSRVILFELVDASTMETQTQGRDHVLGLIVENLRSHSTALMMVKRLLGNERLSPEQRQDALDRFGQTVQILLEDVDHASDALMDSVASGGGRVYSLQVGRFINERVAQLRHSTPGKDLAVQVEQPALPLFVLAAPDALASGMDAILKLVAEDAREQGEVVIRVTDTSQMVRVLVESQGYGIPEAHLARFLYETSAQISPEFQRIREFSQALEAWGGLLLANSEVGRGYQFIVALQKLTGASAR